MRRKSSHLTYCRVHAVHHAQKFARRQGTPLNTSITLNLTLAGMDDERASEFITKLIGQRFCPWFRRSKANRRAVPPTYIWVRENKGGAGLHWALHLPEGMKTLFLTKVLGWVRDLVDGDPPGNAVHVRSVVNCHALRLYMLKGADPRTAAMFGVNPVHQGDIAGSRSGVSRNLQRASRSSAGYRPKKWCELMRS